MISIVKIGGNVVDNPVLLGRFCRDFAAMPGAKLLVHGGGVMASQIQKALGMEPLMIEGRRVTDEESLKVVTMVYAGWCNKHISALLQANGCNALGLAGCDASVIKASRRAPKTLSDGKTVVDYGYVGDVGPESVKAEFLRLLLDKGIVPVLCAINHDGEGNLLNTNADTISSSVAAALGGRLVYCFEKKGVLSDVNDPGSVIPHIDKASYAALKASGVVAAGMIPKIDNAFAALENGACSVVIKHSEDILAESAGTTFSL